MIEYGLSRPNQRDIPAAAGTAIPPNILQPNPRQSSFVNDARDKIQKLVDKTREKNAEPLMMNLAAHIQNAFNSAKDARLTAGVDVILTECLNQKRGKYDTATLAKIRNALPGGSEQFNMLTNVKCRACEAILRNTMMPSGTDKNWAFLPTPLADLPDEDEMSIAETIIEETTQMILEAGQRAANLSDIKNQQNNLQRKIRREIQKEAKSGCEKMEQHVDDQLTEGKFYDAFSEFLTDISTFPTAFIKGPVIRRRPKIVWTEDRDGNDVPATEMQNIREYYRVNPYDIYPSGGAKNIQDGYLIERHRMRRNALQAMKGVPGFSDDAIEAVLSEYSAGLKHILPYDKTRATAEGRPQEDLDPDPIIEAYEYWGFAQGSDLLEWGIDQKKIPNPTNSYQICAWLIGNYVVMARLNTHPLKKRPYYSSSYSVTNDSIWGESPPMLMRDTQNAANATLRAMLNRLAFSSGPMGEVFMDRMAPGEVAPSSFSPWMLLKTKSDITGRASSKAFNFSEIDPKSETYLRTLEYLSNQASEQTGIPNYIYGSQKAGQEIKTASALAMLINNTNALLRNVILGIDKNVITQVVHEHWLNVMIYDKDIKKSGDIEIVARASEYLVAQEQLQLRRNEALNTTNNDWDRRLIGDKGRLEMLRDTFKSLKWDVDEILPDSEDMEMDERALIQQLVARNAQLEAELAGRNSGGGGNGQRPPQPPNSTIQSPDGGAMGREPARLM